MPRNFMKKVSIRSKVKLKNGLVKSNLQCMHQKYVLMHRDLLFCIGLPGGRHGRGAQGGSLAPFGALDHGPDGKSTLGAGQAPMAAVCGKSRSMNRSAVGCGSWFASPGRSLASMIQ